MNYMGQSKRDFMELLQQYQNEDLESFVSEVYGKETKLIILDD